MIGETEAISAVGSMFWGIGGMVIMLVIAYLVYQVTRIWKGVADMNERYDVMEEISLDKYAKKKGNATQLIFLIIPRTSTKYWKKYVMGYADCIYFIPHRLKFGDTKSCAPFPSCIIIFKDLTKKDHIKCKVWNYKRNETVGNFFPTEDIIHAKLNEFSNENSLPTQPSAGRVFANAKRD